MIVQLAEYKWLYLLIFAASLLFIGHVIRVIRWRVILLHGDISASNSSALVSLNIGYFVSLVIPFRLGELVRSSAMSYFQKADFVFILATVAFERSIDFLVLGFLIPFLLGISNESMMFGFNFILAAICIFFVSALIRFSSIFRIIIWHISNIFNLPIKTSLLHFALSLEGVFFRAKLLVKVNFWLLTLLMWFFYILSLYVLAQAINESYDHVLRGIYLLPIDQSILHVLNLNLHGVGIILCYLIAPLFFTVAFLIIFDKRRAFNFRAGLTWITSPQKYITGPSNNGVPKFKSQEDYYSFLNRRFSNSLELTKQFEDEALSGVVVHRVFNGGSGAVTALIEAHDHLLVRKYASREFADALSLQYDWLKTYANTLPLVGLRDRTFMGNGIFYEMDFKSSTKEFYEVIHTSEIDTSEKILFDLLEVMNDFHIRHRLLDCDDLTLDKYVNSKVCENFSKIRKILPEIFEFDHIIVNDKHFNLKNLSIFNGDSWISALLTLRQQSVVHGDLTVENILIDFSPEKNLSWFLIDPNPKNLFSSPFIDLAKLFQSFHLGYESLNRGSQSILLGRRLYIHLHRSSQYKKLYESLMSYVISTYGKLALKQIYLHEIILYLRLIPYQARKDVKRAYTFFGIVCLLILEFRDKYPEEFND